MTEMTEEARSAAAPPIAAMTASAEPSAERGFGPRLRAQVRVRAESPLHVKLVLLTSIALVIGVVIGLTEAALAHQGWPVLLGVAFALLGLWSLARGWVLVPFDRLLRQAERVAGADGEADMPRRLRQLPVKRRDEIGRLARSLHQIGLSGVRAQHEARALRRDIQHQVARSTQQATHELRRMAHRDPLTDLGNRRCMDETLPELIRAAQAAHRDVMCLLIDMDNFKQLNDALGHARGDEALRCLAQLIDAVIRSGDLAVRLGGDEFVLFLPGGTPERVRALAEQLRALFRQRMRHLLGGASWADLSIGVASLQHDGCDGGDALLNKADERLYQAKDGGKGQCCGLGEPTADPDAPPIRPLP